MIFVDAHGETTSEKIAIGRFLDGRVSAVIGTHTHVQTADEQIFPGGTAFLCDAGMCGPSKSILGRAIDPIVTPFHFESARAFSGRERRSAHLRRAGFDRRNDRQSGCDQSRERIDCRNLAGVRPDPTEPARHRNPVVRGLTTGSSYRAFRAWLQAVRDSA